ncbi:hypothetical protein HZH66_015111 [Vespula vulgaris]|uniref:Uncharacterized protein n=1 Tax=Vespula vulgaris TaxID=7454 RepID=A0A834IZ42_VESVU|nr:hypothetical protein HZH66_015111 [Vespula vulgaris]
MMMEGEDWALLFSVSFSTSDIRRSVRVSDDDEDEEDEEEEEERRRSGVYDSVDTANFALKLDCYQNLCDLPLFVADVIRNYLGLSHGSSRVAIPDDKKSLITDLDSLNIIQSNTICNESDGPMVEHTIEPQRFKRTERDIRSNPVTVLIIQGGPN